MWSFVKRTVVAISVVALVGCGASAPVTSPEPAFVRLTNGEPGTLMAKFDRNTVLYGAPHGAAPKSYMLAGQSARVLAFSEDMRWYRIDCWTLAECWVPGDLYSVRLVDASDNAVATELVPQGMRLASAIPAVVTATDAGVESWDIGPLVEPIEDEGPVRVNLEDSGAVEIQDTVTLVTMDHYLVYCETGDELIVQLDAVNEDVDFAVMGVEDAQVYKALNDEGESAQLMVTAPQDFMISVATRAPDAAYDLYIGAIEASSAAAFEPRRLDAAERTSYVFGQVSARQQDRFVVAGPADGLLSIALTSPDEQASFAVVGMQDGRTYKWLYDELPYWSWRLPSHQDYMILVGTEGETVPYSLSVTLHD